MRLLQETGWRETDGGDDRDTGVQVQQAIQYTRGVVRERDPATLGRHGTAS